MPRTAAGSRCRRRSARTPAVPAASTAALPPRVPASAVKARAGLKVSTRTGGAASSAPAGRSAATVTPCSGPSPEAVKAAVAAGAAGPLTSHGVASPSPPAAQRTAVIATGALSATSTASTGTGHPVPSASHTSRWPASPRSSTTASTR